jgi:hypothetical protein
MAKNVLEKVFTIYAQIDAKEKEIEALKAEVSPLIDQVEKVHTASFGPVPAPGFAEKQYVNIRRRGGRTFMCFRNESQGGFGSWLKGKSRKAAPAETPATEATPEAEPSNA